MSCLSSLMNLHYHAMLHPVKSSDHFNILFLGPVAATMIKLEPSSHSTLTLVRSQFLLHQSGSALNVHLYRQLALDERPIHIVLNTAGADGPQRYAKSKFEDLHISDS